MFRRSKAVVSGALAGLLLLSGCSAGNGGDPSNEPAEGVAVGEIDPNGTVRYVFVQNPSTLDPHKSANAWDNHVLRMAYDQLLWQNEDTTLSPMLATSWEFVDDNRALEMELRDDVDFIDGEHFNAEVVKANIERAKTIDGSAVAGSLSRVDSVEVLDEYKVRFNLNGPAGYLPAILADRAGAMISPAAFDNPDLDQNPVGSGMASLAEYIPGQMSRWDRNENYWDPGAAKAAHYEIYVQTASPTRVNMLATGQGELTYLMPQDQASAEAAGLLTEPTLSSTYFRWSFNTSKPPFDDLRVRKAIEHAVDRQAIVDGVFFGAGTPIAQHLAPNHWAYNPEVTPDNPEYGYDPELAKELLAEAGYAAGVEFDMLIASLDDHRAISEAVVPMLQEAGFKVNSRVVESPTLPATFFGEGICNAYIGASAPLIDPTAQYESNLEGQFRNPWGMTSDEFTAAWEKSLEGGTDEERTAGIHEMIQVEKELLRELPIMLFEPPGARTANTVFPDGYKLAYMPHFRGVGVTVE